MIGTSPPRGSELMDARSDERKSWSTVRVAGSFVLASWALLFWFLWLSGRVSLYLSGRTSWVVPVGAALMTIAAAGRLASSRQRMPIPLRRKEALIMTLMVVPVVVILALPPSTLGTFSAQNKATSSRGAWTRFGTFSEDSPLSFQLIAAALTTAEGRAILTARAGEEVTLVGFATFDDPGDASFQLTRFVFSCCVADALPAWVRVVDVVPGEVGMDDWVEVRGKIYPVGPEIMVDATSVRRIDQPDDPYLSV
jgi:uncharacterized repeat protein (TIGR03943 family)